jgi:hypothetical protein
MGFLSRRPRHVTAIAYLALFAALGLGTAWALERNSVQSKHIKNGQVKRKDLRKNAVDSSRVENGSLRAGDLAPGALPEEAFAYVRDPDAADEAVIQYERGVSSVEEGDDPGEYVVSFDRGIEGCAVVASSGLGSGGGNSIASPGAVRIDGIAGATVAMQWFNATANLAEDTSFMIVATC